MSNLNPFVRTLVRRCPHLATASLLAACLDTTEPPAPDPANDRDVLVELYESTGGGNWMNRDGWVTEVELDTWHGVETDSEGWVTEIQLDHNNLVGTIPPELGSLAKLKVLSLVGNRLTGEIPPELGNLEAVELFSLRDNELTGPIPPELGRLANVRWLSLYINRLSGPIPQELLGLEFARWLVLGHNQLSGSIPPGLGSMRSLDRLWLNDNQLTGAVPSEFGSLGRWLEWLDFRANPSLSGPLPRELTNLTGLLRFEWGATGLCSPPDEEFQEWVHSVPTWSGRGPICPSRGAIASSAGG